jgi:hypothetical protein
MDSAYVTGFYAGVVLFFVVLAAVYWLGGRLGWFGIFVRIAVFGVAILKVVTLISGPLPS